MDAIVPALEILKYSREERHVAPIDQSNELDDSIAVGRSANVNYESRSFMPSVGRSRARWSLAFQRL